MNHPDRYEKFVVPEGVPKVEYRKDTKVDNAATFVIQREDHTVGNLLRMELHEFDCIQFAGYKIPHPLEHRLIVKVRTNGKKTPLEAMQQAVVALHHEFSDLKNQFEEEAAQFQQFQDPTSFESSYPSAGVDPDSGPFGVFHSGSTGGVY